jgi:hypothetical protein
VDGLRVRETPHGDEPDLRAFAVPPHLRHVREAAITAAKQAGAKGGIGVWPPAAAARGLWISLRRPTPELLDAAYEAVARRAPAEPVTVLDQGRLSRDVQDRVFRGLAKEYEGGPEGKAFTGRQNAVVLVVCLVGAVLIVVGRRAARQHRGSAAGHRLGHAGAARARRDRRRLRQRIRGAGAARPGSGDRVRPLPLLGFLTVSGLLLWQAVRGLS